MPTLQKNHLQKPNLQKPNVNVELAQSTSIEAFASTDIANFPVGLVISSLDTLTILQANAYFTELYQQQSANELPPKRLSQYLSPASQILLESYVMPLLLHQGQCQEIQLTFACQNQQRLPVLANAKVIQGQPSSIYWAFTVATQRDSLYQELVNLRNALEERAERLEKLSQTDELTGLLNRRAFIDRAQIALKQAQRSGLFVAFLMLDIDFFKRINDQFGHDMGDQVLTQFAQLLANNTRENDIVARIGGEEFAIVVLVNEPISAVQLAEKLLQSIRQQNSLPFNISASIGLAIAKTAEFQQFYQAADELMYHAKHQGRNCMFWRSQCVSVESLQNTEPNKIYAGTRAHLTLKCAHGVCIDAPFSFVVDTLLLPVTIPWSVVNYCQAPAVEPANSEAR